MTEAELLEIEAKKSGKRINYYISAFLIGSAAVALVGVPWYIMAYWDDFNAHWLFHLTYFSLMFWFAAGSITLGYHRLFSHLSFKASWPVKLFTLIFGAAAFEGSAIEWTTDHREHHKHVDHEKDPYNINKGFFWAHIGWLFVKFRIDPPFDNAKDLLQDKMVMWQHRNFLKIAILISFVLPPLIGWWWGGPITALGSFLIGGFLRVVIVQHATFSINSLCHWIGTRPYDDKVSARDSWFVALVTFGEGYHNFHHTFQHDYRNGVKPWQFDPTKWTVWFLSKIGMVTDVRRVPEEKIHEAEEAVRQRALL